MEGGRRDRQVEGTQRARRDGAGLFWLIGHNVEGFARDLSFGALCVLVHLG